MGSPLQNGAQAFVSVSASPSVQDRRLPILWLQGVTLAWMSAELGISVYAAITAHSPAMLAFGSDSLVELLSAAVVIAQWIPGISISHRKAGRASALLLLALAVVVAATALASLTMGLRPETSYSGIGVTLTALIGMPVLATLKRREAARSKNAALAADAVQSLTCAYLALVTLTGVAMNAIFHVPWFDAIAALVALPLLVKEGISGWRGEACGC